MNDLPAIADRIRSAYAATPIVPIRLTDPHVTLVDAYLIQTLNREHWTQIGRRIVGTKIGLTSKAVQLQLGVDSPDYGILFADAQVADDGVVRPGHLLQPKVEAEIAFVLGRDIKTANTAPAELIDSIAYALPALEIVDSRIADWDIKMVDTVADNASSGLFVLGPTPVDIKGLDLAACSMRLDKNGTRASEGSGADCLGNPLNALAWLASARLALNEPLKAGDVILSGALGPMVPAGPGDRFQANIAGIGRVSVRFAP